MAAIQRNWNYYTYVSEDGTTYNIRADVEWAAVAAHGLAARTAGAPRYIASRTQQPRKFVYLDPTTFRTRQGPVGTAAAFSAAALDDAENFAVPNLATSVAYTLVQKIGEKVPTTILKSGALADHA
jgi:hypothetical protein